MIRVYLRRGAARNTFYLKRLGVTHVLNTAEGNRNGTVNTNQVISPPFKSSLSLALQKAYYSPFDIKYKGLKLLDVPQQNISLHFPEVAAFIDEALAEGGEAFSEVRRKTPFLHEHHRQGVGELPDGNVSELDLCSCLSHPPTPDVCRRGPQHRKHQTYLESSIK